MSDETPWTIRRRGRDAYYYDDAGDIVACDERPRGDLLYSYDDEDDEDDDG